MPFERHENPLLDFSGLARFGEIRPEHITPAVDELLRRCRAAVAHAGDPATPATWETLVERGYSPEIAYLECVHQLKYLADLLHERGPAGFRAGISGTALYGAMTRGPRVVGEASRREMKAILEEIRSGAFAREWTAQARGAGALVGEIERGAARLERARKRALDPGPPG